MHYEHLCFGICSLRCGPKGSHLGGTAHRARVYKPMPRSNWAWPTEQWPFTGAPILTIAMREPAMDQVVEILLGLYQSKVWSLSPVKGGVIFHAESNEPACLLGSWDWGFVPSPPSQCHLYCLLLSLCGTVVPGGLG